MRRCDGTRDDLVLANLGFVSMIATEYRNLGVSFDDLLHEGALGLITAASRFDRDKRVKFTTYAVWRIRKTILKCLADQVPIVRVSRYQRRRGATLRRVSLDSPRPHGRRRSLADALADDRLIDTERETLRSEELARLWRAFRGLSAREREIVEARFGLDDGPVFTLQELGERFGVSRERVRQIQAATLQKLKAALDRESALTRRRFPAPPRDAARA